VLRQSLCDVEEPHLAECMTDTAMTFAMVPSAATVDTLLKVRLGGTAWPRTYIVLACLVANNCSLRVCCFCLVL